MAEHLAVNERVLGSSPSRGAASYNNMCLAIANFSYLLSQEKHLNN